MSGVTITECSDTGTSRNYPSRRCHGGAWCSEATIEFVSFGKREFKETSSSGFTMIQSLDSRSVRQHPVIHFLIEYPPRSMCNVVEFPVQGLPAVNGTRDTAQVYIGPYKS